MKKFDFSKWLSHPVYFFVWFFAGLVALSFSFESSNSTVVKLTQMSSESEVGETEVDLSETNYLELQSIPDDQLLHMLEQNQKPKSVQEDSYALPNEYIEEINKQIYEPENTVSNNFQFQQIIDDTLKTDLEDPKNPKVCSGQRLFYEKQISANPKIKDLVTTRDPESASLPRKCLIHIMNKTSFASVSTGLCAKSSGAVHIPGAKPCITESLVNLTYNSYVDVMDCLNLNAKFFLPKISSESGFILNAYGAGKDGGIGQFTRPAIESVNQDYDMYMTEIAKAAETKPSCARIMQHKALLTKAAVSSEQRCAMIGLPENPLRNILYVGIFNKSHMDRYAGIKYIAGQDFISSNPVKYDATDEFEGVFKDNHFKQTLQELGLKNPNMHFFKEVLTLAGYNMGSPTALRLFTDYLKKRKAAKKPLKNEDFDFNKVRTAKDVNGDGKEKNVIEIARSTIMSSFISAKDSKQVKEIKVKKRKALPKEWASSYLKSFPEYLTYNANNYDGKQITRYDVYGAPGYVSFVADRNRDFRNVFNNAGVDPDYCSDPNFLILK